MATGVASSGTGGFHKALADLEAESTLITNCAQLCKDLTDHYASLPQTLVARSQSLDAKFQSLDSETNQALAALDCREASIPDREYTATALIQEQKSAVISETRDPDAKPPADLSGFLQLYCRRMDSAALWRLVVSRRRDPIPLRKELSDALALAVDPPRLVLNAMEDFLKQQPRYVAASPVGDRDWGWALRILRMLLWALFGAEGKKPQEVSESIKWRAAMVAEALKVKLDERAGQGGVMGGQEAEMLLQMVAAFGLSFKFDEEFLRKLVLEHASRREMSKLAVGLFREKLADIINELVNTGKVIAAVYFAHESGLTEQFSPVPLLKSYLQSSKKNASNVSKNGNHSSTATEESSTVELSALKSIIKCVETLNLEQKFNLGVVRKRVSQLERAKTDRRRIAAAAANKSQNKRTRSFAGDPNFRPAKAIRTPDAPYASLHRDPPTEHQIPPTCYPNNYPGQVGFDAPASTFGAAHNRSPASIPIQYYGTKDMAGLRTCVPYGGPSVGYSGHDYAAAPHTALAHSRSPAAFPRQYYGTEDMAGLRTSVPYGGPIVGYSGHDYAAAPHTAPAQPAYPHQQ